MKSQSLDSRPARREFLKTVTVAGASAFVFGAAGRGQTAGKDAVPPSRRGRSVAGLAAPRLDVVRWGLVGVGGRGTSHLRRLLLFDRIGINGVCDIDPVALNGAVEMVTQAARPAPVAYGDGPEAYKKLVERTDIDAVLICTPWRLHTPMAVAAMRAGKHAFIEVPAAVTVEECWALVDTAEETRRHCMMLENACYGREELMVLNMCRRGLFGELIHGEGAYLHDMRAMLNQIERGRGVWRTREHELRDGNLYPTHGLGPIAQYMNINRGDRFDALVSLSSLSLGLTEYAEKNFPPGHPRRVAKYICGDVNTSIIKTARGRTILVQHNTANPRPYSRINMIQGTRGLFAGYPSRIYVEGRGVEHEWDTDLEKWHAEFEHPLWTKGMEVAAKLNYTGGHGGIDIVMTWRILQCLHEGLPLDQDVYDAAAWSAVGPLSEQSVAREGASVAFPDFTRNEWRAGSGLSSET